MTTELNLFKDAYATIIVATYEPLILRWVSAWQLMVAAITMAPRSQITPAISPDDPNFEALAFSTAASLRLLKHNELQTSPPTNPPSPLTVESPLPTFINRKIGVRSPDFGITDVRMRLFLNLFGAAQGWTQKAAGTPLAQDLRDSLRLTDDQRVYDFLPLTGLQEALSPIGIAHFYRQLFFNIEEGVGPLEEAFTIAPLETFEVVYESTRRQIHEEQMNDRAASSAVSK